MIDEGYGRFLTNLPYPFNVKEDNMKVNIDRIEKDMDFITSISASPGKGCTRLSFSKEDEKVRKYIISELEKIGANIKIDGLGNIRARINDKAQSPSIMIGSHIDTVPSGGKFDEIGRASCRERV